MFAKLNAHSNINIFSLGIRSFPFSLYAIILAGREAEDNALQNKAALQIL